LPWRAMTTFGPTECVSPYRYGRGLGNSPTPKEASAGKTDGCGEMLEDMQRCVVIEESVSS
jgi:hypothetical protein